MKQITQQYSLGVWLYGTLYKNVLSQAWWHMPLATIVQKQKQVDLYEFQASPVCIATFRLPVSHLQKQNKCPYFRIANTKAQPKWMNLLHYPQESNWA